MGTQFNCLFNSCKAHYIYKTRDFILEGLINKYKNSIALTKYKFQNKAKTIFPLIVFKNDVSKISKYELNLIIDYLMETKQNCSDIIHLNRINDEISVPIMKELFYILLNKSKTKKNNNNREFDLNIKDMADIILEKINQEKEDKIINLEEESVGEIKEEKEKEINSSENEIREKRGKDNKDNSDGNDDDDKRIEKILSKNNNNIKINELKRIIKEKIKSNKKDIKEIAFKTNQIINPFYFYNLWKDSFTKEKYKSSEKYKIFIKVKYIMSSEKMNSLLNKSLCKYKINFFDEEPSIFTKKITKTISQY